MPTGAVPTWVAIIYLGLLVWSIVSTSYPGMRDVRRLNAVGRLPGWMLVVSVVCALYAALMPPDWVRSVLALLQEFVNP